MTEVQLVFREFPKLPRWSRDIIITEKIDGTNASIFISEYGDFLTGSRTRWITPDDDNHGFSRWAHENKQDLQRLGPGHHFGEWWGAGIQRKYGLTEKRFSLFNVARWADDAARPSCCSVVPTMYQGPMNEDFVWGMLDELKVNGSRAAPGFMDPEGIVIWHTAANKGFKKTIKKDEVPKSVAEREAGREFA